MDGCKKYLGCETAVASRSTCQATQFSKIIMQRRLQIFKLFFNICRSRDTISREDRQLITQKSVYFGRRPTLAEC